MQKAIAVIGAAALVAVLTACSGSDNPNSPATPSRVPAASGAAADGSTLKVTAPVPSDPVGGKKIEDPQPTFVFSQVSGKFVSAMPNNLVYHVQLLNSSDAVVEDISTGRLSVTSKATLDTNKTYKWRVRAEVGAAAGPWSTTATFVSADVLKAFNNEKGLYDPLIDGKTIGTAIGPVTFTPQGAKLQDYRSYIQYLLPHTVIAGEFSMLVTNVSTLTPGSGKTKVMAMSEGLADIVTNERRFTLEKRGDGNVAWRMITADQQIDTIGRERRVVTFHDEQTYLWQAVWTTGDLRIKIFEGGAGGRLIYNFGKGFSGRGYNPDPHYAFAGSPLGRSGVASATLPGMVVRQLWLSKDPRPAYANK